MSTGARGTAGRRLPPREVDRRKGAREPYTVLLVDDNPVNREMWSLYLAHKGYRVETAPDGIEALRVAREEPVDLILLDVMMPGMSGFEVLVALRSLHSPVELPIIMATARDQSEDIVKAFDLGANDYVTKPLNLDVVLVRMQAQLRSKMPLRARTSGYTPEAAPGTVLEGKYRVEALIGQGSFGAVYRATHLSLRRPVAVKLLAAAAGNKSLVRFRREGISTCRVQHPNAVEVLDLSITDTGIPFLVMELLNGHSLDEELKRVGTFAPMRAAEILVPTCAVLAEAHAVGLIHRDVKPQNVFLHRGRHGEVVKVLDFGIAKMIGETALHQKLTIEGSLVGTPAYMAPERLSDRPYDGRADIYSLGVMLYEMLVGRRPFVDSDLIELIRMQVYATPQPPRQLYPDLSPEVEAIVLRALAKDPARRLNAEQLARGFAAAVDLELTDSLAIAGWPATIAADRPRREGEAATNDWVDTWPEEGL